MGVVTAFYPATKGPALIWFSGATGAEGVTTVLLTNDYNCDWSVSHMSPLMRAVMRAHLTAALARLDEDERKAAA